MSLWIDDGLHKAEDGIRSFLLVGQSNMAGRGDLSKENALTAPDCFMLRMGRWQKMSEPINVDRAVTEGSCPRSGANLAASFAAQLQKETGAKIGLIPCAGRRNPHLAVATGRSSVRPCRVSGKAGTAHLHLDCHPVASGRERLPCPGAAGSLPGAVPAYDAGVPE